MATKLEIIQNKIMNSVKPIASYSFQIILASIGSPIKSIMLNICMLNITLKVSIIESPKLKMGSEPVKIRVRSQAIAV